MSSVIVNNGHSQSILHQGFCLSKPAYFLVILSNFLYFLALRKNLLSIHKFTSDTNYVCLLDSSSFVIMDKQTRQIISSSRNNNNLYQLTSPIVVAYSSVCVSFDVWHRHLGQPSSIMLKIVFSFVFNLVCHL